MSRSRSRVAVFGLAAGAAAALLIAGPVRAVPPGAIGSYPTWSVAGAPATVGTADFAPGSLPDPAVTSDSVAASVGGGSSAYLGPGTTFGQEFGTTRAQPYLTLRPRSASPAPVPPSTTTPAPSTTTIDFGTSAPPAGWGFAVGDIDADWVFVRAYDAGGAQLPVSALGERAIGNYCASAPRPSTCTGVTAPYDVPNWTGASSVSVAYGATTITWAPGTVYGNAVDTAGAYAWFTPAPGVRRVTLLYGALTGSPNYQLWLAAPAPSTTLTGTVTLGDAPGAPIPPGTSIELETPDGSPVVDLEGDPVIAPVDPAGTWSLITERRDAYRLAVIPPPGYTPPAPVTVAALSASVVVAPFVIDPAGPSLAATGTDARGAAIAGATATAVGLVLVTWSGRRRRIARR